MTADHAKSLKNNIQALSNHLVNPRVKVDLPDVAYTLSEGRSCMWQRAFLTPPGRLKSRRPIFIMGKITPGRPHARKISLVLTGQGAEWPQMGREMLGFFPSTRSVLEELDAVLQAQPDPPAWSLVRELSEPCTAEHMRQPELSQPLVTAVQLCIFEVLRSWGVPANRVVAHGSGEIAAAYATGLLDRAGAIKAAFYRGRAVVNREDEVEADVGILAVDLGAEAVSQYMEKYAGGCWISYFNSHVSVTISGRKPALEALAADPEAAVHVARLKQADLAYHSPLMGAIGEEYRSLLKGDPKFKPGSSIRRARMLSSVTAAEMTGLANAAYWESNIISPVRFEEALTRLVEQEAPSFLIEVGPSGALAGPVSQTLEKLPGGADVSYCVAWSTPVTPCSMSPVASSWGEPTSIWRLSTATTTRLSGRSSIWPTTAGTIRSSTGTRNLRPAETSS